MSEQIKVEQPSLDERLSAIERRLDEILDKMDPTPSVKKALDDSEKAARMEELRKTLEALDKVLELEDGNSFLDLFYNKSRRRAWWYGREI